MKAVLEFDLSDEDDKELHSMAVRSQDAFRVLSEIRDQIFRPARKHGYDDKKLQKLIDNSGTFDHPDYGELSVGPEIIEILEDKFSQLLNEYNVNF